MFDPDFWRRRSGVATRISGAIAIIAAGIVYIAAVAPRRSSGNESPAELVIRPTLTNINRASPSLAPDVVDAPHFSTQPATGVFGDGGHGYTSAQCTAALDGDASSHTYNGRPINQETVPPNSQPHSPGWPADGVTSPVNQTKPTARQLAYYASDGYRSSGMDAPYEWMKLVDGQYAGTTEMIIRWAACKWGIDEDMIRAQATAERGTWIQWNAGGDERRSIEQCRAGNDPEHGSTNLWGYIISSGCYQSWSIWQTKVVYSSPDSGAWTTWPAINESTAFAADYRFGSQRSCMNGGQSGYFRGKGIAETYLNDVESAKNSPYEESPHRLWNPVTCKYATNLEYVAFACLSSHYSGGWMDRDAQSYLRTVLNHWSKKDWLPK
jgi:hypothetical protein